MFQGSGFTIKSTSGRVQFGLSGPLCRWRNRSIAFLALLALSLAVSPTQGNHGRGAGQSFLVLEPGFTQEIVGLANTFVGGVAFAPDGDPWINDCLGRLTRFDLQGVAPEIHGTKLHPAITADSTVEGFACGMANHPDGFI